MSDIEAADCPIFSTDKLRYADTDRQGHVNNAVFATFLETGRVELIYDPERPLAADGAEFVLASLSLAFKGEVHWPGTVEIGTWVRRLGNSSIHIGQVVFQDGRCVAEAETVVVQIDRASRKALPLSEEARERLSGLVLERDPS